MTISSQTTSVTLVTNGSQTTFDFAFLIPFQPDGVTPAVNVYAVIAGAILPLVNGTDYTIIGAGIEAGGSITTEGSHSPLVAGTVTIERALVYEQPSSFPPQGFYPPNVEIALDFITLALQQIAANLSWLDGYTVATLPATATIGQRSWVSDATAPAFLGVLTGGGTVICPVWYNGTQWVAG